MHELSIAYNLVEMASAAASKAGVEQVCVVHLRLGLLSGVVRGALEFSFEIAANGTPLEGAQLVIEEMPVLVYCAECQKTVQLANFQRFRCPICDTPTSQIVAGREMDLVALEYAEPALQP